MLVLIKMLLKLLFMSDLWLGAVDSNNIKNFKKLNKELMLVAWHPKN